LYYNRRSMTWLWGVLAVAALLWPDRVAGVFDGVPLDRVLEAIAIGMVLPVLLVVHPRFLTRAAARVLIVLLVAARVLTAATFKQDGWCVRFEPARRYVKDQTGAPHAWDLRADWRSPDPACSAIMTRSYGSFAEFPAWFLNLPPPDDNWPGPLDLPPEATTRLQVRGYLSTTEAGTLALDIGDHMTTALSVDGGAAVVSANVAPGTHVVAIDGTLTGDRWRLVPTWNGADLFASHDAPLVTATRPSTWDVRGRPWMRPIATALAASLLVAWLLAAIARVRAWTTIAWSAAASLVIIGLVAAERVDTARWAVAALIVAAIVPVAPNRRDWRSAFLLVGVPWLTFVAACAAPAIGRFVLYDWGNDYWSFQRFAYRIVMQGYWLEGGSPTFWFQPLYRWIAGLLHVVFGDSSVGEWFWDGWCLLAGAIFSFEIVRPFAGVRWALAAAVLPLAAFVLGTPQYLIGRGLGEITSMGFVSLAAIFAMRSRAADTGYAIAAGVCAVLAFYTRMNNLIMAAAIVVFAVPIVSTARPRFRSAAIILATLAVGLVVFAWRTWYYTGVFSVFHGTQRDLLAIWQPGMSFRTVVERALSSVAMVLTVNDPPRYDPHALPVLAGAAVAAGAAVRLPRLRDLPLPPVLFFFAAIAGAVIARGSAYPGRFSIHVIPITCALVICAAASLMRIADRGLRI
jgi:hypothetical protein